MSVVGTKVVALLTEPAIIRAELAWLRTHEAMVRDEVPLAGRLEQNLRMYAARLRPLVEKDDLAALIQSELVSLTQQT